jgi:hypothetical protein
VTTDYLFGVSCVSATDCTAVGYSASAGKLKALTESWNGTAWSLVRVPSPANATGTALQGVSCRSATACTAVDYYSLSVATYRTLIESWNGTA